MESSPHIFACNVAVIARRWPQLWQEISGLDDVAHRLECSAGPCPALQLDGIQLASRWDRAGEARIQAQVVPANAPVFHVYGVGMGDLPGAILQAHPGLQRLYVHLANAALFVTTLHLLDFQPWLSDARIELCWSRDEQVVAQPFFAHPAEMRVVEDACAQIRDGILVELTHAHVRAGFGPDNALLTARLTENRALVEADRDVAELFGKLAGRSAAVVGAGPTLEQTAAGLCAMVERDPGMVVVVVDTALKPLRQLAPGLRIDYVVSIDRLITQHHLQQVASDAIALVYFPLLPHDSLSSWRGPRYCAYSNTPLFEVLSKELPRGVLYSGGSVIHPAVDLAVRMGCTRITLFGTDFCFPFGKTHAVWKDGELNSYAERSEHWVLNGLGQRVPTYVNFATYLSLLERYIRAHPAVRFFSTSRDGAHIRGTSLLPMPQG